MMNKVNELEAEREKLRTLQAIFENAVKNNSIEDLRSFIHSDFSFVSFTDKLFKDFDAFKKQWGVTRENMVGSGDFSTRLNPSPTLFEGNIAIASGNADNTLVNSKGQKFEFTNHWTVIFKQDGSEWKVLCVHNSLDPFGNPMLISGIKQKIIKYSVMAFLGGGALTSILSYFVLA